MDHPDSPGGGRPPRKELQGPRPAPLKVRKESHKIKKPPVVPPHHPVQNHQPPPQQPPRQPVIIYTVSPKVIHTHPSEFMTLVQRLTGPDATSSSHFTTTTTSSSSNIVGGFSSSTSNHLASGGVSPAARFASIEKTKMHSEAKKMASTSEVIRGEILGFDVNDGGDGGSGGGAMEGVERAMVFPGILSPGPGSLPPISPNLFSPFFHDSSNNLNIQHHDCLNVVQQGNRSFIEGSYLPSPFSTTFASPNTMFSPNSLDFLHRVLDS